ncbi:MAG TPA: DNA starvation/stationary phase protection protein Dps [Chthoniobacter sp.]|nr:DNA starvation/stationary phase protection protein Dps [Chthoniobacter sp.]
MSTRNPSLKNLKSHLPHKTGINLPDNARSQLVTLLNQQLANLADLHSQTKQAHWNVRGEEFYQLHKLFDDLAEPFDEFIDTVAERAVTLGGLALGTARGAAAASELPEFPLEPGGFEYAKELAQRFVKAANSVRDAIDTADDLGDKDAADIFTQISRELDKSVYFLEAHFRS